MNKKTRYSTLLVISISIAGLAAANAGSEDFFGPDFELGIPGIYEGGNIDPHTSTTTKPETLVTGVLHPEKHKGHRGKGRARSSTVTTTAVPGGTVTTTTTSVKSSSTHRAFAHNAGGAGLDGAYFFTRNIGVDLGTAWVDGGDSVFETSASLIYRMPFMTHAGKLGVAPYVLAGGDGLFGHKSVAAGHVGGGVEFRCSKRVGIFVDGRWVIGGEGTNFGAVHSGMRFTF